MTEWIEFEIWKNETCICGYMAEDEADDESPLQFYDRNGFECGGNISATKPILEPCNDDEEEIVKDWDDIVEFIRTTDVVQYLVDFAEEAYSKNFDDIELFINCSKLDAIKKETTVDKSTTIRVKESTKERLNQLGHKGMSYDDIIRKVTKVTYNWDRVYRTSIPVRTRNGIQYIDVIMPKMSSIFIDGDEYTDAIASICEENGIEIIPDEEAEKWGIVF